MKHTTLGILLKGKSSPLSREEINYLIEKTFLIASAFTKCKFSNTLYFPNFNLQDISMDAIIPLFVKNSSGILGIIQSLESWNDILVSEADAEYFLSRIVWKRVEQTISKELKNNDPIFEKILKTLNFCIKNNELKKVRYFGTVYVVENENNLISGKIICESRFNTIPNNLFGLKQLSLFKQIFNYIVSETDCFPAIPLNILVKRVKQYHLTSIDIEQSYSDNSDETVSVKSLVNDAMIEVKEKIDTFYVNRNKLNPDDALIIYSALTNISKDLLNGGIHSSLYSYLKEEKNILTKEEFYRNYHNIMNYLYSTMKSAIVRNLEL